MVRSLADRTLQVATKVEKAGLYVRTRKGAVLQVKLPPGCLAYQIGETSQIHTGGLLQATPHAVKGTSGASRQTYAQFMQPEIDGLMTVPMFILTPS